MVVFFLFHGCFLLLLLPNRIDLLLTRVFRFLDFFLLFLFLSVCHSVPTLGVRAIKNRLQRATSAHPNKRNTRDPSHKKIKKRGIKKSRPGSAPARQTPTRRQQQQQQTM